MTGYVNLKKQVVELIDYLRCVMYPNIFGIMNYKSMDALEADALKMLDMMLDTVCDKDIPYTLTEEIYLEIKRTKELIDKDVQAAYEGDPAA